MTRRFVISLAAAALALQSAPPARAQTWDFSYAYRTVFDAHADDHVVAVTNAQKVLEGWAPISFYTPIDTGTPSAIRYRFDFPRPTVAIHLFAVTNTYNYGLGVGDASVWGSVDGQNWTLISDHPRPTATIDSSLAFDGLLPPALLGATQLWIEARMIRHSGAYPYGAAQFSRMDTSGSRQVTFGIDAALQNQASYATYRASCPGSCGTPRLLAPTLPRMGQVFYLRIEGLCPRSVTGRNASGHLFFTFGDVNLAGNPNSPLPVDLGAFGAPGCLINVDTAHRHCTPILLDDENGDGAIDVLIGVPTHPSVQGFEFYNQFAALDPAANALGIVTTNAGRGVVGN